MTGRPNIPVVPLREAAALLGLSVEAARSALRHHGVRSGYPREAVEWLRDNRPGPGARTDLKGSTVTAIAMTEQTASIVAEALEGLAKLARRREVSQAARRVAELHRRTAQVGVEATHDEARELHHEIMSQTELRGELDDELRLVAELAESGAPLGQVISIARANAGDPEIGSPMLVKWLDKLAADLARA